MDAWSSLRYIIAQIYVSRVLFLVDAQKMQIPVFSLKGPQGTVGAIHLNDYLCVCVELEVVNLAEPPLLYWLGCPCTLESQGMIM